MKKYPIEIREKIIKEYNNGKSQKQLSREYGISRYVIQCLIGVRLEKNIIPKQRKRKLDKTLPSMSRKGNPYDNSLVENFFSILKSEWINRVKLRIMKILII